MADPAALPPGSFRWQALFQQSADPLFLLNRRRRILFVNHAWERLTRVSTADARALVCRRRRAPADDEEALGSALSPPQAALHPGAQASCVRRLWLASGARHWWDVEFWPLAGSEGVRAILGKIRPVETTPAATVVPLPEKLIALRRQVAQRYRLDGLTSELPTMTRVNGQAALAMQSRATVLIVGEPGVGKQWLARLIHHQGQQRELGFVALDCAGLPAPAVASVLFDPDGLARRAGVGTVYLRAVDALARDVQAQVNGWLNDPRPRPRVIASLATEPAALASAGRLLEELACALGTLTIALPPLRERSADLRTLAPALVEHRRGLAPEAWDLLRAYSWPENLSELKSVLQAAHAAAGDERIEAGHLPAYLRGAVARADLPPRPPTRPLPLAQLLEQVERRLIELALKSTAGNKSQAARLLAVSRPLLLRRIQALGIAAP